MIGQLTSRIRTTLDLSDITTLATGIIGMAVSYAITYSAGGTHTVFPHLFYAPVLLFALRWGPIAGGVAGVIAGILCGPLMPLNVDAGSWQSTGNWLTRMAFFVGIAVLSGAISQRMQNRHRRVQRFHSEAIRAFVRTIDAKCPYTARHSERVSDYAFAAAVSMGLPKESCEHVRWAGLMHDIGKLWIPDEILNKNGPLDEHEWEQIRQHPVMSEQLLTDVEEFQSYRGTVRGHHERYDGAGYPDGLVSDRIPLPARILSVADSFEAMTAERPYRPALTYNEAVAELRHNAGTQFDPFVVETFCSALQHERYRPSVLSHSPVWDVQR